MSVDRDNKPNGGDDERRRMGERLRQSREYLGFSQEEVAAFLGVSRPAISLIETGQRKVDAFELKRLAGLYERPAAFFTGGDTPEDSDSFGHEIAHLARKAANLSSEDRAELGRFADFLRARKPGKGA